MQVAGTRSRSRSVHVCVGIRSTVQENSQAMSSRLYYAAARVIRELESKRGSLASLVFTSSRVSSSSKKKLYAIVSQTIKRKYLRARWPLDKE